MCSLSAVAFGQEPARQQEGEPARQQEGEDAGEQETAGEQEPAGQQEVVVRGARPPLRASPRDATAASSLVEGEELRAPGATSADVLARVPGVQVARLGAQGEVATASIRGSDSKQVPVYVAGIRINDDVSGTADLSTVPLWMMERVEVFRGNAPAQADRLGLGGAIFFTPRIPEENGVGAGVEVGSLGQRGGWVSGEVAADGAASLVAVRRRHADNDFRFVDDQGQRFDLDEQLRIRQNADYTENEAWAIGRYQLAPGAYVTSVMQAFQREQGVTGLALIPAREARGDVRRLLLGVSSRLPCRTGSGTCGLEFGTSLLTARLTLEDPLSELPTVRSPVLQNQGDRITQTARLWVRPSADWKLSASAYQAFEFVRIDRAQPVRPRGRRATTRLAATAQWRPTRRLLVHGLGAAECHSTGGVSEQLSRPVFQDSETCNVLEPVGRVGAKFEVLPQLHLLANGSRYIRVPTLAELYGTSSLVNGNAALQPERGWSVDAGARGQWSPTPQVKLAVDAFGFVRTVDDLIRFRRSSLKSVTPFNVASARFIGAELAAGIDAWSSFRARTALTAMDPRETTSDPSLDPTVNDLLPLTARWVLSQSAELYTDSGWEWLAQDSASLTFRYSFRAARFADSAGQIVLPDQHFVDVEASSAFLDEALHLRLAARNVLDQRTSDLLGLPLPGRTYHASAELWF